MYSNLSTISVPVETGQVSPIQIAMSTHQIVYTHNIVEEICLLKELATKYRQRSFLLQALTLIRKTVPIKGTETQLLSNKG